MVAVWMPDNPYYGFRTPATMPSLEEWRDTNRPMNYYMNRVSVCRDLLHERIRSPKDRAVREGPDHWGRAVMPGRIA